MSHVLKNQIEGCGIAACLIDIDATITTNRTAPQMDPGYIMNNAIFDVIAQFMYEQGWEYNAVADAFAGHEKSNTYWDYPDFLKALDLPEEEVWNRIVRWHNEHIVSYKDAVSMVKRLHVAGIPLFIVSNNPLSGCLLKLQSAGLAGPNDSPYFREILGTNVCMGGKWSLEFWQRCMDRTGYEPGQLAVIGDNPREDCTLPRSLGVETVFLVDRKRERRFEKTPEAFMVNTLDCVPEILLPTFRPHAPMQKESEKPRLAGLV